MYTRISAFFSFARLLLWRRETTREAQQQQYYSGAAVVHRATVVVLAYTILQSRVQQSLGLSPQKADSGCSPLKLLPSALYWGEKRKWQIRKAALHTESVSLSVRLCTICMYSASLSPSQMHALSPLPSPLQARCVCVHTHTHTHTQGHTVCPLTNFMYSKRKLRTFEETMGGVLT